MKNAFAEFNKLSEGQFKYGATKYASTDKKEATDELFDNHGYKWLIGTLDKYTYRFTNLARERDLLKIATYCYIIWLKRGFHVSAAGLMKPVNTTVEIKSKYFADWVLSTFGYYELNQHYLETTMTVDALKRMSNVLVSFSQTDWFCVTEEKLTEIYCLCFVVWHDKYYRTGDAGKDTDTNNESKYLYNDLLRAAKEFFKETEYDEEDLDLLVKSQMSEMKKKKV